MNVTNIRTFSRLLLIGSLLAVSAASAVAASTSAFTTRPDDPGAITLTDARGDGQADDSAALQAAIDKAAAAPCTDAILNTRQLVAYEADYYFYMKERTR